MLAKEHRFHGHTSVRKAYKQGSSIRGGLCSLHVTRAPHITTTKVAVVVSKKVHKSAVIRNRIRRRMYEIVRLQSSQLTTPAELVFTVYQADAAIISYDALLKQVTDVMKRAKLLK